MCDELCGLLWFLGAAFLALFLVEVMCSPGHRCPRCNNPITKKSTTCHLEKYPDETYYVCPNCGQLIDWDGIEEK